MNKRMRKLLVTLVLFIGLGTAALLGRAGVSELIERNAGDRVYAELALQAHAAMHAHKDIAEQSGGAAMRVQMESAQESAPVSEMDFETLISGMPNIVGWIKIDGTSIDYPIVQGGDNSFYLSHLPDGNANAAGSIMMDVQNRADFSDFLTVLHGHHMRAGRMFGDLEKYADAEYRKAHGAIRLYTPNGDFTAKVVAAWHTAADTFSNPLSYTCDSQLAAMVPDLGEAHGYLLLSTCSYAFENARFVVLARRA